MTLGALAGFALVFVVTAVTLSAFATLALQAFAGALRERGPMVERRAAEAAALLPVVVAVIAVAALTWQSLVGSDHCEVQRMRRASRPLKRLAGSITDGRFREQ